jgi:hypothetical protein
MPPHPPPPRVWIDPGCVQIDPFCEPLKRPRPQNPINYLEGYRVGGVFPARGPPLALSELHFVPFVSPNGALPPKMVLRKGTKYLGLPGGK